MNKIKLAALSLSILLISCKTTKEEVPTPVVAEKIVYTSDVENIMYNYCTSCHGGNAPSAYVSLSTYDDVKHHAKDGNLISRMNDASNPMPPNGMLSETIRKKLDDWAASGYLEN